MSLIPSLLASGILTYLLSLVALTWAVFIIEKAGSDGC